MAVNLNISPSYQSQVVSKSIESIPETILAVMRANQDNNRDNRKMELEAQRLESSKAIAERTMAMQEGKYQWEKGLQEKLDNSKRALSKWTSEGYAWDALSNPDSREVYGRGIPSTAQTWAGYKADMQSFGGNANQNVFLQEKNANDKNYMNQVMNRWIIDVNALKSTPTFQNLSKFEKSQALNSQLNASKIYQNYADAFGQTEAHSFFLQHIPEYTLGISEEVGFFDKILNMGRLNQGQGLGGPTSGPTSNQLLQQAGNISDAVDQQTGFNPKAAGIVGGLGMAEALRRSYSSSVADATKPILKDIGKDWKGPAQGGMDWKKFQEKYNIKKGDASTSSKSFQASKDITKKARRMAGPGVWSGAKSVPAYLAAIEGGGLVGSEVGSIFGDKGEKLGKEAGRIGGTVAAPA